VRLLSRRTVARYVAPAVFLLAVTVAILLVRSSLTSSDSSAKATTAVTTTAPPTTPRPRRHRPTHKRYYVIRSGDTLEQIAARFGTTVDRLLRLNPGVTPTALRPGDRLRTL
jgi:LysM repeat protein